MLKDHPHGVLGRPRSFDTEEALERAMQVFWEKGYEGTSLSDLTKAMGINRPSLYAAFGDKESLFRKALERYMEGPAASAFQALQEPVGRKAIEGLLLGVAAFLTEKDHARGCLGVQAGLSCESLSAPIREVLAGQQKQSEMLIAQRLKKAKQAGELPADADPAAMARYFVTVLQGMAVQSSRGATRPQLKQVAKLAMAIWPEE